MMIATDKNLGPAIIKVAECIKQALLMLGDINKCTHMSENEANQMLDDVKEQLKQFLNDCKEDITKLDKQHINRCINSCTT